MLEKKVPINNVSLAIAIITLILGILLCFNSSDWIFDIIGYCVAGLLCLTGIIKFLINLYRSKKGDTDFGSIIISVILVALGIFIAVKPGSVIFAISLVIGTILIFSGVQRLVMGVAVHNFDRNGSNFFIIESIVILVLGIIIITQKFVNLIGLFLIIYSISELAGYIYYNTQDKNYEAVLNKKVTKEMKESVAVDAIVEEDNTTKKDE